MGKMSRSAIIKTRLVNALRALDMPPHKPFRAVATQAPPTPVEAIEGGYAYDQGRAEADNPYPPGSQQHEDWAWGFVETQYRTEYAYEEDQ